MKRTLIFVALIAITLILAEFIGIAVAQTPPAFPGAEGFGAAATMQKNGAAFAGDVYHVTSLDDTLTPGTLRYGIRESGFPAAGRIIVFDVGGTIQLTSSLDIKNVNGLYIAGQTAPSPITIIGETSQITSSGGKTTQNVIARYLTFRKGTGDGADAITFAGSGLGTNLILDHVSASWAEDETLSVANNNTNITVQYSIISESLNNADHGFGSLVRPRISSSVSFHHNLYANNKSRQPRAGTYDAQTLTFDFRNNVVYNWSFRAGYAGGSSEDEQEDVHLNYVGNYLIAGPSTTNNANRAFIIDKNVDVNAYQSGNVIDSDRQLNPGGAPNGVDNGWSMWELQNPTTTDSTFVQEANPFATAPVVTQAAVDAYWQVINYVGNSWANRSDVDARVVNNVLTNTGAVINNTSAITAEWNALTSAPMTTRPAGFDADNDGMADAWEASHGGASLTASGDVDNDGYSNIEEYINDLGAFPAPRPVGWTGGTGRYALNSKWDTWQPSRFDTVNVNSGKAIVDAVGQHAGTLNIGTQTNAPGSNGEVEITGGWLDAANDVNIGFQGTGGSGVLRLSGGSLAIGSTLNLRTNGTLILGGGTLALNAAGTFNWDGGTLQTTANQSIGLHAILGAAGGTLDTTDKSITYSGNLTGQGGLTKLGTGSLALSGVNQHQGDITVSAGQLTFANAAAASASSILNISATATTTLAQQPANWTTNASARYTMPDLTIALGGVLDLKNNRIILTSATLTEAQLAAMKADGRIAQTTGVAHHTVGYSQSGANLIIGYAGVGDSNMDGQSNNQDLSAMVLAGKYIANGSGPTATWDEGDWTGDGKSSAADISALVLSGFYSAGAQTSATLAAVGNSNDGEASVIYDPATGSLVFSRDGDSRDIREIRIASATGQFITANAANLGDFDVNDASLQDRFNLSATFADGYHLGNLLAAVAPDYDPFADLTIEYGIFGGGALVPGSLVVAPEPTALGAMLAMGGLLIHQRRH